MALGIYDSAVLNRTVESLKRAQAALFDKFFTEIVVSDKEKIYFDLESKKRRIAPFVHPTLEGKIVQNEGFTTRDFEPAYIKDKRVFDPGKALKRSIGESIGGTKTPRDRTAANLARALADQQNMIVRRQETMASEILRTGKVTVTGDGYPTVVVDFLRDVGQTLTLAGAARWGEVGVVPLDDMRTWATLIQKNSGAITTDCIMDTLAWDLFVADQKTKDQLDVRRAAQNEVNILKMADIGLAFQGTFAGITYWTYQDWYVNDAGTEVDMVPNYTVIISSKNLLGVRHYGAIRDEDAGLQAMESYSKSWVIPDPSVRYLMTQSAPLPVPYRANASMGTTVR